MRKLISTAAILMIISPAVVVADDKGPDKPWHNKYPLLSTPNPVSKNFPMACRTAASLGYVKAFQNGADVKTIKPNQFGLRDTPDRGWLTWTIANPDDLIPCPDKGAIASEAGMCWKELGDKPEVHGIVAVAPGQQVPHYHREMECYYGLSGQGYTWAQERMQAFGPGDFLEIPSKTIHYTPNVRDDQDLVWYYWFPMDGDFSTFKYQWPRDVGPGEKLMFDLVPYSHTGHVRSGNGGYGYDVPMKK